ncbi:phospholipid transporting ATPase, partial [Elasticomyces elasticus]
DERPIYPASVAHTATTYNPRSNNGSDGTDHTARRSSLDRQPLFAASSSTPDGNGAGRTSLERPNRPSFETPRHSFERPSPSFDRLRTSMDRTRPSFEASNDFTSAAYLARVESSHSGHARIGSKMRNDITGDLR